MVYIVSINPKGFPDFAQESVYPTYEKALAYVEEFSACHGNECDYRIYNALNEYTSKRKLLLER